MHKSHCSVLINCWRWSKGCSDKEWYKWPFVKYVCCRLRYTNEHAQKLRPQACISILVVHLFWIVAPELCSLRLSRNEKKNSKVLPRLPTYKNDLFVKNIVFWDMTACTPPVPWRFERTYCRLLQGRREAKQAARSCENLELDLNVIHKFTKIVTNYEEIYLLGYNAV
jgi:hypothetical protein